MVMCYKGVISGGRVTCFYGYRYLVLFQEYEPEQDEDGITDEMASSSDESIVEVRQL